MADVKWIKLATELFDNRKIRQIECLPDGDAVIVIWMKLLCLAGNINDNGLVYFTKEIPYTDQMLSTQFNRPLTTVQLAIKTFEQFGMVEVVDNILHISNWEKYQNVEGMERIREQTRKRVAKHREKKKLETSEPSNVTVTQNNAIEVEEEKKRIDKDIDRECKRVEQNPTPVPTPAPDDIYNSLVNKYGKAFVDERITRAKKYINCTMATVKKWCEEDALKKPQPKVAAYKNFNQRTYNNEEIEKKLLNRGRKSNEPQIVNDDP